ncbi:MAG: exodeoxyribonuclease III [Chthonomonas sp.]|nr:exodeoxyribonuclease III [Chthonomonas sp.]
MRIATFNANSIRLRLETILEWMASHNADVMAIQETKVDDDNFPRLAIEEYGYHVAFHGQKTHYGVATISKMPPLDVSYGIGDSAWPDDKRILCATYDGVRIVNTYVPNGTKVGSDKFEYKLRWLERFGTLLASEMRAHPNTIWLGDINIAPKPEDVHDSPRLLGSVGHHPSEFSVLEKIVSELGLTDCFRKFNQEAGQFTFWEMFRPQIFERNLGWRIDHIYASFPMAERCVGCEIDKGPRAGTRPSDHTVVYADFD